MWINLARLLKKLTLQDKRKIKNKNFLKKIKKVLALLW